MPGDVNAVSPDSYLVFFRAGNASYCTCSAAATVVSLLSQLSTASCTFAHIVLSTPPVVRVMLNTLAFSISSASSAHNSSNVSMTVEALPSTTPSDACSSPLFRATSRVNHCFTNALYKLYRVMCSSDVPAATMLGNTSTNRRRTNGLRVISINDGVDFMTRRYSCVGRSGEAAAPSAVPAPLPVPLEVSVSQDFARSSMYDEICGGHGTIPVNKSSIRRVMSSMSSRGKSLHFKSLHLRVVER